MIKEIIFKFHEDIRSIDVGKSIRREKVREGMVFSFLGLGLAFRFS